MKKQRLLALALLVSTACWPGKAVAVPTSSNTVAGSAQNKTVAGSAQNNTVAGSAQNKTIAGSAQNKTIAGSAQNKTIAGSAQNKTVPGSAPSKAVVGSPPSKTVAGSAPSKTVVGSPPSKTVVGSPPSKAVAGSAAGKTAVNEAGVDAMLGDSTLSDAIQEYNTGNVDKAVALLLQELKRDPENGRAHYYLGSALKKVGADANAVHELEMAIKYCPPGTLQALAQQALHGDFKEDEPPPTQPPQSNFFSGLFTFFQPPASQTTATTQSTSNRFQMPDMFHPVSDAIKSTKSWVKKQAPPPQAAPEASVGRPSFDDTETIHMGDMLRIAEESQKVNPNAQSHPSGVMRFPQAPEGTTEWNMWIRRFRMTFNKELFRHMATQAKDETGGTASVIFSVDNKGHLRGCVYSSTSADTVTSCLLQTIRELDKSYVLAFPSNSHISGWNFRMKWNFRRALVYIQYIRRRKAEALAAIAKMQQEELKTTAMIKSKALQAAELAKAKKLVVKAPPPIVVKTGVSGLIVQKPKPVELKAVPLKLSDMPPLTDQDIDEINMKGDSSPLFN
jgi:hypothetical protein